MAKKKESSFLDSIFDFGQKKVNAVIEEYIQEKITKQLVRIGEVSIAFFFGVTFVIVGTAQFIAHQLSFLENGLNYIVLGSILLLVAYFLS